MFKHVGLSQLRTYFDELHRLLLPGGRLISGSATTPRS
jgi:cyclopropane fatty-acyl-phospholipid synthase-like methyltransferase